jgi:hypothetical protein
MSEQAPRPEQPPILEVSERGLRQALDLYEREELAPDKAAALLRFSEDIKVQETYTEGVDIPSAPDEFIPSKKITHYSYDYEDEAGEPTSWEIDGELGERLIKFKEESHEASKPSKPDSAEQ